MGHCPDTSLSLSLSLPQLARGTTVCIVCQTEGLQADLLFKPHRSLQTNAGCSRLQTAGPQEGTLAPTGAQVLLLAVCPEWAGPRPAGSRVWVGCSHLSSAHLEGEARPRPSPDISRQPPVGHPGVLGDLAFRPAASGLPV